MRLTPLAFFAIGICNSIYDEAPEKELWSLNARNARVPRYGEYEPRYRLQSEPRYEPLYRPGYDPRYKPRYEVYDEQQFHRRPHYYWLPRRGPQPGQPRDGYTAPGWQGYNGQDNESSGESSDSSCQSINLVQLVSQLQNTASKITDAKDSLERFLLSLRTFRLFEVPQEIYNAVGFALSITRDTQQAIESLQSECGHKLMNTAFSKAVSVLRDGQQDLIGAVSNLIRNPWGELHDLKIDYHNLEQAAADTIGSIIKFLMEQRQSSDNGDKGVEGNDSNSDVSDTNTDSGFAAFTDFSVPSSDASGTPADTVLAGVMPTQANVMVAAVSSPGHHSYAGGKFPSSLVRTTPTTPTTELEGSLRINALTASASFTEQGHQHSQGKAQGADRVRCTHLDSIKDVMSHHSHSSSSVNPSDDASLQVRQGHLDSRREEVTHELLLTASHGPFAPNSISIVQHPTVLGTN